MLLFFGWLFLMFDVFTERALTRELSSDSILNPFKNNVDCRRRDTALAALASCVSLSTRVQKETQLSRTPSLGL